MAKAFIPQVGYKTLDLAEYGGEGLLRIYGMTPGTAAEISATLQSLAIADGYDLANIEDKSQEINVRYSNKVMIQMVKLCTQLEDETGYRNLTDEEVNNIPFDVLPAIYTKIEEQENFPLPQTAGAESK